MSAPWAPPAPATFPEHYALQNCLTVYDVLGLMRAREMLRTDDRAFWQGLTTWATIRCHDHLSKSLAATNDQQRYEFQGAAREAQLLTTALLALVRQMDLAEENWRRMMTAPETQYQVEDIGIDV